jgi:hypothetical protein
MSKESEDKSNQSAGKGGLVYLKYTYRYRNQFNELDDNGLKLSRKHTMKYWELIPRLKTKL